MVEEIIKLDIKDYENYQACSNGFIYNKKYKRYLSNRPNKKDGYIRVGLSKNGKVDYFLAHQLIAEAFLPKPEIENIEVDHKNHNRSDNRIENLRWMKLKDNRLNKIYKNQIIVDQLPEDAEELKHYGKHELKYKVFISQQQKQLYQMMDENQIKQLASRSDNKKYYYYQTHDINNEYFAMSYKKLFGVNYQQ